MRGTDAQYIYGFTKAHNGRIKLPYKHVELTNVAVARDPLPFGHCIVSWHDKGEVVILDCLVYGTCSHEIY